jgi:hypothetical protein
MIIVTNTGFVKNRGRIAKYATILGFVALLGGFLVSLQAQSTSDAEGMSRDQLWVIMAAYASLVVGLIAVNVGRYNNNRWGRRPREEEVLETNLKGLDYKYQLFNYQTHLPVDHLLLSPFGLFVLETRPHYGDIENNGSRWKRKGGVWAFVQAFAEGGLGNPSREALKAVEATRKVLRNVLPLDEADAIPVEPVVVFTSAMAKLSINDPIVPVLAPKDLKTFVRSPADRTRLTTDQFRQLARVLKVEGEPAGKAQAKNGSSGNKAIEKK